MPLCDGIDGALPGVLRLLVPLLPCFELAAVALLHALDVQSAEILEHAPVPQAFLGELDDRGRDGQLDQLAVLVRRPDERRLVVALFLAQLYVLVHRQQAVASVGRLEVLLEAAFFEGEVRRGVRDVLELGLAIVVHILQRGRDPVLADIRIALQREALRQGVSLARVVDEDRAHAALHRQAGAAAARVVGDTVLRHAGRVGVEHGGRLVVAQEAP